LASEPSIYWYDFETTGIDSIVDRPLQVAGIRTDHSLHELDEAPINVFCRPGNDVVPNPDALLVTGIKMSAVLKDGLPEREFASQLLDQFSRPNTCVAGFNSLRFDDEFTRQLLYRNFHDPYAREWQNGNSRWDVIDVFRAAYALRPDGLNWPKKPDGTPSFRLEDLARANNLPHMDAHDALADVRATIAVARLLKEAQPKLFNFAFGLRDKRAVLQQLYPLGKAPVVHVSSMYSASKFCTAIVAPLCQHPTNSNAVICFDLAQSPEALATLNPAELARRLFTRSDQLGSDEPRIALKTIQVNRSPFVAPMSTLNGAVCERLGVNLAEASERMRQLIGTAGIVEKLHEVFRQRQFEAIDDPDYQLYDGGFSSEADRSVMSDIVTSPLDVLPQFEGRFQDDRFEELLFRYRARNSVNAQALTQAELKRWDEFRQSRWLNTVSPDEIIKDLESRLIQSVDEDQAAVLNDLKNYLQGIALP